MDYERFLLPSRVVDEPYITRKLAIRALDHPEIISLAGGLPDLSENPVVKTVFTCRDGGTLTVDEKEMRDFARYQSARGNKVTLDWIHKIHAKYHNPPTMNASNPDVRFSAVLTPGCMGAMNILFRMMVEKDDAVLIEEFSFAGIKKNIKTCGGTLVAVRLDEHGIIPDDLRDALVRWQERANVIRMLRKPRLLCTIPTGQNPTGVTSTLERKREIYKIAREHDLLIIEDDPYYYLQYTEELERSYQSIDTDGRVIRLDSASKLIAPGYRFGWVTGPDAVIREIVEAQQTNSMSISSLSEVLMIKLFNLWGMEGFHQHITHLREHYKASKDKTIDLIQKYLSDLVECNSPKGGIFIWLKLKGDKNSIFLSDMEFCEKHGIFAVPGIDFACDRKKTYSNFRICFTATDKHEEAIKRLKSLLGEGIGR